MINIVKLVMVCQGKKEHNMWGYAVCASENAQPSAMSHATPNGAYQGGRGACSELVEVEIPLIKAVKILNASIQPVNTS